jgi:hypothetical protein
MAMAVNSGVIGIRIFSLCCTVGKKDLHRAHFFALSRCVCQFLSLSFLIQVPIVDIRILS